jgi:hypothetical protein
MIAKDNLQRGALPLKVGVHARLDASVPLAEDTQQSAQKLTVTFQV